MTSKRSVFTRLLLDDVDHLENATADDVLEALHGAANLNYEWLGGEYGDRLLASEEDQFVVKEFLASGRTDYWPSVFQHVGQTALYWGPCETFRTEQLWQRDLDTWTEHAVGPWGPAWDSAPQTRRTTRSTPYLPAFGLVSDEDDIGVDIATVLPVTVPAEELAIYEVDTKQDWVALVEFAPLDVTSSRQPEWERFGLPDGHRSGGGWFTPDWRQVVERYDGVHLTLDGYLDIAGVPLATEFGWAMLAGWAADETLWLRDAPTVGVPMEVFRRAPTRWS